MARLGPTGLNQLLTDIKNWVNSKLSNKADTAHTHTGYAVKHTYTTAASAAKNWYRIANANTKQVYTGNPIHVEFILTAYNSSYDPGYSERWYVRAMVLGRNAHVIIFGSNTAPFNQCRVLYENTIADIDDNDRPAIDIYLNYVLANGTTKIEIEEVYNQGWTFVADGQLAVSTVPTGFENTAVSVRGNGVERSSYSDIATYLNKPRRDITSNVTLADNTTYRSTTLNCTGNRTITLPSINSAYFWCVIKNFNAEAGIITIHPSTTSVLIDGSNDDIILRPGEFVAIHSRAANSFTIVGDNRKRTCLVGRSGEVGTDTKHWFRVAQKTIRTTYKDAFILFDVFQVASDSSYMGRLCAHVRVDNTIGVVGNKQFTWLYRGTQLSDDDFAMTTIETSGTSLVVDIWCKRAGGYSAFAFAIVSEGFSTDSLDSPAGKWILTRERATVGDLESLDTGFTTVTNPSVVTLANSITGNAGSATVAQQVRKDPAAGSTADLLYSQCAGTDYFRLQVGGASNAGYAEIATADDGSEPIYVRQYKGTFTTLQRTATLLDGSGNTSFPGQVTGNKFDGPLTWSGAAFSYNAGNSLYYYSGQPAIANCFEGSSNDFTKFSYPAGGTAVSSSNANIQTLRLDWGNTYWHDLFMSPNNNYLWHRNVVNSDARGWRRIVEENVTGLTDQSWNINIAGTAAKATGNANGNEITDTVIKGLSISGKTITYTKIDGNTGTLTTQDTVYTHPTTSGNKHIPSGGSSGQFLGWDSDGTAKWVNNPNTNTDTLMTQNVSTTDSTYPILLCATANATTNQGAKTGIFGSGVKVNPKTSVVSAKGFSGVPTGTTYVTAVKDGGALVNSQTTSWGAIWRAPTKDYQVAGATWSNTNNNVYICYSVTNANAEAGTNTMAKSLIWAADTGTLTTTTFSGALSGNASSATEFSANKDVTLTGDVTGTTSSKAGWSVATTLANSGVTAGTYGPSADVTGNNNATISVPEITVDAKGRVTSVTNRTLTCKNNTYNVYDKTLTIQKNGTNVATFTSNSNTDVTANITVPTKVSELTNDSGYLTSHQSLSNYVTLNTAQEITNAKTFKDATTVRKLTTVEAGNVIPASDKLISDIWQDKNGKELGRIYYYKNPSGNTALCLRAGDWFTSNEGVYTLDASGTNRRAELHLYSDSSGNCCIKPVGYFSAHIKPLSTSVYLGESTNPFGRVYANTFEFCNAGLLPDTDVQTTEEHSIGFFGQNNTPLSYITFQKRPNLKDRVAIRINTTSSTYKSYCFDASCLYPESSNSVDIGSTTNTFKNIYCNNYYKGTTAFGDIVTHNASEFLTSHQSLSSCVKNSVVNSQTIKSTAITRGTAPSSTQTFGIPFTDNNGVYIGNLYGQYASNKSTSVGLFAYKGTTTSNSDNAGIQIGYDASGNVYTSAPTPASLDNSTKIATTAFVYNTAVKHLAAYTYIYVAMSATGNGSGSNTSNYMSLTDLRTYLATVHMHSAASNLNGSYSLQILFKAGDSFGDATFDATKMPGVRNLILNTSTGTNSTVDNYSTNSPTFGNINVTGDIVVTMRNLNCTGRISSQYGAQVFIDTYMGISSLMASNSGYLNVAKNMVINVCDAHVDYLFSATNNGILAMWPGATVTINFRQQCYYSRSLFMSSSNGTAWIGYSSFKLTGTEPMAVWGGSGTLTGTSETAAATVEKAVTLASGQTFTLTTNATAKVKFTVDNTAANPTLNIGGTGAKPIYWNNAPVQATMLMKNITYDVKYNGSQFVIQNAVKRLTNNDFGVFRSNGNYNQTYNSGSWNFTGWTLYYGTGIENSNWRGSHIGNIQQNVSTSNNTYPVLISGTANATANTLIAPYFAKGVKINPSTNVVSASGFSGPLTYTDTVKAITGSIVIQSHGTDKNIGIYNGDSASDGGGFWAYGKDHSNGSLCRIQIYNTSKSRYERVDLVGSQFLPSPSGEIDCGGTSNKWKSVYATNYYYGNDNVEFSTKFVTTDTDQRISGTKTFGNGTLIIDNGTGSNVHGEIKLDGTRPVYINADNSDDGLFASTSCGMSILLNDASKSIHIGGVTTGANGRKIIKTSEKVPYLTLGTQEVGTQILVPENDTADSTFSITSTLKYASGASAKSFTVRFKQSNDGSSSVFPVANNKTDLGLSGSKWKGVYATNFYENGTALSSKYALNENFGKGTTTYLYIKSVDFPTGSGSSAAIQYDDVVDGTKLYVWYSVCSSSSVLATNPSAAKVTGTTGQVWRYLGPTIYAVGLGNYGASPTGILGLFRRES